jgi:hypothetical protein
VSAGGSDTRLALPSPAGGAVIRRGRAAGGIEDEPGRPVSAGAPPSDAGTALLPPPNDDLLVVLTHALRDPAARRTSSR